MSRQWQKVILNHAFVSLHDKSIIFVAKTMDLVDFFIVYSWCHENLFFERKYFSAQRCLVISSKNLLFKFFILKHLTSLAI